MARLGILINTLAAALVCALPSSLLARPHAHPAVTHSRLSTARAAPLASRRHESRRVRGTPVHVSKHPAGKRVRLAKVSVASYSSVRQGWVAAHRKAESAAPSSFQREKNLPASPARGVVYPPALNETGDAPASIPVPVISVIRKTTERPQLPSVEEVVANPAILPSLFDSRGRLVIPPALRGSHEILLHQNEVADRDGLARVQDDEDLMTMRRSGTLVALPENGGMRVDERLPENRRFCRPWTAQFLSALARAHYAQFHTPLQVNSAVRTVSFQQRLLHINGNAAPAGGETASPHLTGQAVDLAKKGLSLSEIAWMRGYLLPLVQQGKIDVEEEFQQSCFHISVYKAYLPSGSIPLRTISVTHRDSPAALAIALQ